MEADTAFENDSAPRPIAPKLPADHLTGLQSAPIALRDTHAATSRCRRGPEAGASPQVAVSESAAKLWLTFVRAGGMPSEEPAGTPKKEQATQFKKTLPARPGGGNLRHCAGNQPGRARHSSKHDMVIWIIGLTPDRRCPCKDRRRVAGDRVVGPELCHRGAHPRCTLGCPGAATRRHDSARNSPPTILRRTRPAPRTRSGDGYESITKNTRSRQHRQQRGNDHSP